MVTGESICKDVKNEVGFTLVELSLVIVIIGLIVAGVVGGQSLVQQAKLRGLISDIKKYELAINTFKLEYDGIPGDFRRAADFGIGPSGNGDKQIINGNTDHEDVHLLVHLKNAGIYEGPYFDSPGILIGVNVPTIDYDGFISLYPHYAGVSKVVGPNNMGTSQTPLYQDHSGNVIMVGETSNRVTKQGRLWTGFLSVKDASSIDSKMDDGEPGTGRLIVSGTHNITTCTTRRITQALPVAFNFADTTSRCRLFYKL